MFVLILRVCHGMKGALREKVSWAQQKSSRLYCSVSSVGLVPTTSISTKPLLILVGKVKRSEDLVEKTVSVTTALSVHPVSSVPKQGPESDPICFHSP